MKYTWVAAMALALNLASNSAQGAIDFSEFSDAQQIVQSNNFLFKSIGSDGGPFVAFDSNQDGVFVNGKNDDDLNFGPMSPFGIVGIIQNSELNSTTGTNDEPGQNGVVEITQSQSLNFNFLGLTFLDGETDQTITINATLANGLNIVPISFAGAGNNKSKIVKFAVPIVDAVKVTIGFGGSGAIDNLQLVTTPLPGAAALLAPALLGLWVGRRRMAKRRPANSRA